LTLGVVDGHNSGIGGGCLLLIRAPDGTLAAVDGRETAPARATRDMFLRQGKADPKLSRTGALAVGVPGALAAYDYALAHFGKQPLKEHLLAAALLAEEGFAITPHYAARLRETAGDLGQFPAARAVLFDPDGQPKKAGDILRQLDLAKTYRLIAEHGLQWFYRGPFARATAAWMREHGGLLSENDFAGYEVKLRQPIVTTYRSADTVGFPPPSSGGVHVAQMLNVLEHFDLQAMGRDSTDFVHLIAEAMKLAFADRAHWLGDPDFAPVPKGLVSKTYAETLAARIRFDQAALVLAHGVPEGAGEEVFGRHTTHLSTADTNGFWVACTSTLNTSFGAKVVIPGTGVMLNNQMDDFSAQPRVTNYFGLLGAEANAVAPGKRPLTSMSPTLVLRKGQPILAVGASGGPTIINQTLLTILNVVDFGLDMEAALARPRFHHQWRPDELQIEPALGAKVLGELQDRGHKVTVVKALAATHAVAWDAATGQFQAAADPRGYGKAGGW
jgi:gamma-glutamyltranspeptidase/glutathione hydrolase